MVKIIEELKQGILDLMYDADWDIDVNPGWAEVGHPKLFSAREEDAVTTAITLEVLDNFLEWITLPNHVDSWDQEFFETWIGKFKEELQGGE